MAHQDHADRGGRGRRRLALGSTVGVAAAIAIVTAGGVLGDSPDGGRSAPPPGSEGTDTGESRATGIPAGFPLDWGLDDLGDGGGRTHGPGARVRGVPEVSPCDLATWPVDGVDRLAVTATVPMLSDSRELVTFSSAVEARAAMAGIRSALGTCRTEVNEQDPTDAPEQAWDVHPETSDGDRAVTFSRTYTDGLPGGTVWQFTRVGRVVLAVSTDGEYSRDAASYAVARLTEVTDHLRTEVCVVDAADC